MRPIRSYSYVCSSDASNSSKWVVKSTKQSQKGRKMSKKLQPVWWLICAAVIGTLIVGQGFGQVADGNLVGSILDASGAGVANATVEVENAATGVKSTTMSNETGFYRFNNL